MYVKEVTLLPLFLEASGGDWDQSWKSIRDTFSSGKWNRGQRAVEETYGPPDVMKTEDNRDVWEVWRYSFVGDDSSPGTPSPRCSRRPANDLPTRDRARRSQGFEALFEETHH